jgi:ketosteroid isomerase-like protein
MEGRSERLREAFAALENGDVSPFRVLFVEDAQWLGIVGAGFNGATPT